MKKGKLDSVVLLTYNEERLKETLQSIIYESFDELIKDNLSVRKDEIDYISVSTAAKSINKSSRTIYNWIESGLLTRYFIGESVFIRKSELLNLPSLEKQNKKE